MKGIVTQSDCEEHSDVAISFRKYFLYKIIKDEILTRESIAQDDGLKNSFDGIFRIEV